MQTDVHGEEFQTTHFIVFGMSLSVGKWNGDLIIPFTYSKYGLLTGQMFLLVGVVSGRRGDWLSALLSCSLYVSTMMFWYNFRKGRIADIDRCLAIASGVVASVRIPRVAILGVIYFFRPAAFSICAYLGASWTWSEVGLHVVCEFTYSIFSRVTSSGVYRGFRVYIGNIKKAQT